MLYLSHASRSSVPTDLEKLGKLKSYQDYTIPSHPSAVSSFQTQPREARPYGELQGPTQTRPIGLGVRKPRAV